VARLVAEHFDKSVHHKADDIREAIVKGFAVPALPYNDETREQFQLARTVTTFAAKSYADAGFTVVVDDAIVVYPAEMYRSLLADQRAVPVFLRPSKETLLARMRARNGPYDALLIGLTDAHYDEVIGEVLVEGWNVIDNSHMTAEATAAAIVRLATD
jgi:predicted kinase